MYYCLCGLSILDPWFMLKKVDGLVILSSSIMTIGMKANLVLGIGERLEKERITYG